jgi:hypothetical protein
MNRTAIDLWVGIFVAIGLAAIVFLALKVGNLTSLDSVPSYRLEARFDNIGGLKMRAPVKAAGVVVGRVDRIRLDPKTYEAWSAQDRQWLLSSPRTIDPFLPQVWERSISVSTRVAIRSCWRTARRLRRPNRPSCSKN